jgi:predicted permease
MVVAAGKHVNNMLHQTVRQLWASRGFTALAVLTLALGIGGTTAIFTLIDAVMLRPLPVTDPARLYRVGDGDDTIAEGRHGRWGFFSFPLYERLKAGAPEFEDITAFDWGGTQLNVRRQGTTAPGRPLLAEYVTGSYFSTLGVRAFSGRVLTPADDRPSAPPVVVLSHRTWQDVYGADGSIIGSTLAVQDHSFTVVGVAAPEFFGDTVRAYRPDMWLPLQQEPMVAGSGSLMHQSFPSWLAVIGRIRRDASVTGMAPRLTGILRHWIQYESEYPSNRMPEIRRDLLQQTIQVVPAGAGIGMGGLSLKEQYGPSLQILLAICCLVLVIACANVANLELARAVSRRAQTAVRVAIGATRRQIVAEALTESVLLAAAGGLAGLVVAVAAARLLVALAFRGAPFVPVATTPSLVVLAFATGVSFVTGVVFGAAPAWFSTRTDPIDALRGSGRSTGHPSSRARTALLIVQATLSVVLIAGSTMLARSLANLQHQDFGYRVQGRVLIGLGRLPATYTLERLSSLYGDVEQRLAAIPGVRGTGLALYNPLTGTGTEIILVAGHPPNPSDESGASRDSVSTDYLQNLGVTLVRGRMLTAADNDHAAPVAVVNESFVKRFFKNNEDPLDQHFGIERPENAGTYRIVGIVHDAKFAFYQGLTRPARPMFFVPLAQHVDYEEDQGKRRLMEQLSHFVQSMMVVTDSTPGKLEPLLRKALAETDPNLTITTVRTMQQQIDLTLNRERAVATLAQLFGVLALVLAAVGVYGVTAWLVARQTNEIGIRMALGADPAGVIRLVLRRSFQRAAAGLVAGLPCAVVAARFMAAQLYGVSFWDPFALTVAAVSLAGCTLFASMIPAARAAAISPMSALHSE